MNFTRIKQRLFRPIDIAALVFFRVAFGGILLWEVIRYFDHGWIKRYWIDPQFFFTYDGFHWLSPWSGDGMYYHFYALGFLAFFIAIGFFYRISTILFWIGFTYIFLLDKTNYLNHFYLISLLSFIMIFLPANRAWSVDVRIFPGIKSDWAAGWTLLVLRLQFGVLYFFGGVAKINADWLQGEPMRMWLEKRQDFPVIGRWFTEEWLVYMFSYSGLLLDLLVFPLLLFKRTRLLAFLGIVTFHLMNARLFEIGIFPWFVIFTTAIFFPPHKLRFWRGTVQQEVGPFAVSKYVVLGLAMYMLVQVTVPLRHFFYAGNVSWTEEGHRFSWHMKLRSKSTKARIYIVDQETGKRKKVRQSDFLSSRQRKKMKSKPDMILQFAHYLKTVEAEEGHDNISVTAKVTCSLNGRPKVALIDPTIDLSSVEYPIFSKADWILPLKLPLKE